MTNSMLQKILSSYNDDPIFRNFSQALVSQIRTSILARSNKQRLASLIQESYNKSKLRKPSEVVLTLEVHESKVILHSIMDDQPFIMDTLRMHLIGMGAHNMVGYNAVIGTVRDEDRVVKDYSATEKLMQDFDSVICFQMEGLNLEQLPAIEDHLKRTLRMSSAMVSDFRSMTRLIEQQIAHFDRDTHRNPNNETINSEVSAFLEWVLKDNFVFMGADLEDSNSENLSLGILNAQCEEDLKLQSGGGLTQWRDRPSSSKLPIFIRKGDFESPIHRLGQVDLISIDLPIVDAKIRLHLIGLFTHRAINQSSRQVPVLRKTLAEILVLDGCKSNTHRSRGICKVFDSLPTEFLFVSTAQQIHLLIDRILDAEQDQAARAKVVHMEREDNLFIVAAMPQNLWSDQLRSKLKSILMSKTGATYCDSGVFIGRHNTLLAHFFLTGNNVINRESSRQIEEELTQSCTPWNVRIQSVLTQKVGTEEAELIIHDFTNAFQSTFKQLRPTEEAVNDILVLHNLRKSTKIEAHMIFAENRNGEHRSYLRIYQGKNLVLSDMLPVIDNFGMRVVDQFADPVELSDQTLVIDTFRLEPIEGISFKDLQERQSNLCDGLEAVFAQKINNDPMNRLLLGANLNWEAVDLFRALFGYAKQLELSFTIAQTQAILLSAPQATQHLWKFFESKFSPSISNRSKALKKEREAAEDAIRKLETQSQDLVFRSFFNLIDSMLRTNFYKKNRSEHTT